MPVLKNAFTFVCDCCGKTIGHPDDNSLPDGWYERAVPGRQSQLACSEKCRDDMPVPNKQSGVCSQCSYAYRDWDTHICRL